MATQTSVRETSKGFDQMAKGMRSAFHDLENAKVPSDVTAAFDTIAQWLKPLSAFSLKAWRTTVRYSRQHPVRVGITVLALGFLAVKVAQARRTY
jgi:hypothetical protein